MACRVCETCGRKWPVQHAFLTCAYCCRPTKWSGDEVTTVAKDVSFAERVAKNVKELHADIAEIERYAAGSARPLSFPMALRRWPTASDVPGPFIGA